MEKGGGVIKTFLSHLPGISGKRYPQLPEYTRDRYIVSIILVYTHSTFCMKSIVPELGWVILTIICIDIKINNKNRIFFVCLPLNGNNKTGHLRKKKIKDRS